MSGGSLVVRAVSDEPLGMALDISAAFSTASGSGVLAALGQGLGRGDSAGGKDCSGGVATKQSEA
jgi:hypothetical protein